VDQALFLTLTVLGRLVSGVGAALCLTSIIAIITQDYHSISLRVFSVYEFLASLNTFIIPPAYLLFYMVQGYSTVFIMSSLFYLLCFIFCKIYTFEPEHHHVSGGAHLSSSLLKYYPIQLLLLMNGLVWFVGGYCESLMALHFEDAYGMSVGEVTIMYSIYYFVWTFFSILVIFVPQAFVKHHLVVLGGAFRGVASFFIGPFLLGPNLGLTTTGIVLMGMGAPIAFPPTMAAMREVAVHDLGFANDKKLSDSIGSFITGS
jgi:hypothetical protein